LTDVTFFPSLPFTPPSVTLFSESCAYAREGKEQKEKGNWLNLQILFK